MHPEHIIFDFDSTFIQGESLDALAEIALREHPEGEQRLQEVRELTSRGMDGSLSFAEGLARRLRLFEATKEEVDLVVAQLRQQITPSVARNHRFLRHNREQIFVVSSGFFEIIYPIVSEYGISPDHVFANRFLYDYEGRIVGCDPSNPLSRDGGKID